VLSRLAGESVSEEQADEALSRFGLSGYEETPVRKLSQGQQRRVALSRLLLSKASLLILDEPFVALDAAAVELLQSVIVTQVEQGGMAILIFANDYAHGTLEQMLLTPQPLSVLVFAKTFIHTCIGIWLRSYRSGHAR